MQVNKLPRGRLLKTKVKEAKKVSEAIGLGLEVGKQKAHKKKKFEESLREHIGKFIDRIEPMEFLSTLATTYIVHGIILTSAELYQRTQNITKGLRIISGTPEIIKYLPFGDTPLAWAANIPFLASKLWDIYTQKEATKEQKEEIIQGATEIAKAPEADDLYLWAVSFAIAYYVQKHGIKDILGSVRAFLGFATAA